jgi:hypothetical protein
VKISNIFEFNLNEKKHAKLPKFYDQRMPKLVKNITGLDRIERPMSFSDKSPTRLNVLMTIYVLVISTTTWKVLHSCITECDPMCDPPS